ncbi:MAG TPA: hypothetical protein VFG58_06060 [Solirubrobacterales bacterium]|nr:hypothetical protein [Solirubrobacterales bacterium]
MVSDLINRLTNRWYEECEERSLPTDSYHALRKGLRGFLPTDAPAGIAYRDEHPFVLALAPEALLFFTPPADDQLLDALAIPIGGIHRIAIGCGRGSSIHANYRVCTWGLTVGEGERRDLITRRAVGAGFTSDNGGEGVMFALAERLGWPTPLWQEAKETA